MLQVGPVREHEINEAEAEQVAPISLSPRRLAWRRFRRHKLAMVSAVILILLSLMALFASVVARYPYEKTGVGPVFQGPSGAHWFGTDAMGCDLYSRVVYGGRISLAVGFAVAIVATLIGTIIGATSGYFGGKLDNFVMLRDRPFHRAATARHLDPDAQPPEPAALGAHSHGRCGQHSGDRHRALAVLLDDDRVHRPRCGAVVEAQGVCRSGSGARRRRPTHHRQASPTELRRCDRRRRHAERCRGDPPRVGAVVPRVRREPARPYLGNLLSDSKGYFSIAPWLIWFPGLVVIATVLAVNFVGDGLRDALDPRQQKIG